MLLHIRIPTDCLTAWPMFKADTGSLIKRDRFSLAVSIYGERSACELFPPFVQSRFTEMRRVRMWCSAKLGRLQVIQRCCIELQFVRWRRNTQSHVQVTASTEMLSCVIAYYVPVASAMRKTGPGYKLPGMSCSRSFPPLHAFASTNCGERLAQEYVLSYL